jgi:hypothetical protein
MRELLKDRAITWIVGKCFVDPVAAGIAASRQIQHRTHRVHIQQRQLLLLDQPGCLVERTIGVLVLAFFERHLCREQMCFGKRVVFLQKPLEQAMRLAFELLGKHARDTQSRLYVAGRVLQDLTKNTERIVVLMGLQKQTTPAHTRLR